MNENLENKIKEFEERIKEARKFKESSRIAPHGERIVELIREGDYSEARMVTRCLIECGLTLGEKPEISEIVTNYLNAAYELGMSLPKNQEYLPERDSWRD